MSGPAPWKSGAGCIDIAVRATPRGGYEAFGPGTTEHFAARIAAPPVEGAANTAVVALVAAQFGVPKRAVSIIAGETARLKRLRIEGDTAALAARATLMYGVVA